MSSTTKRAIYRNRSLNRTILNNGTNGARPKERRPFKSNIKPNKSFSGVDAEARKALIEHVLKNLNLRFVGNEVLQCINQVGHYKNLNCLSASC